MAEEYVLNSKPKLAVRSANGELADFPIKEYRLGIRPKINCVVIMGEKDREMCVDLSNNIRIPKRIRKKYHSPQRQEKEYNISLMKYFSNQMEQTLKKYQGAINNEQSNTKKYEN